MSATPIWLRPLRLGEARTLLLAAFDPNVSLKQRQAAAAYGPVCAYARTLPFATRYRLHPAPIPATFSPPADGKIMAIEIPESCLWEPVHPFLYELKSENDSPAPSIGLRALSRRQDALLLNGKPLHVRGLAVHSLPADGLTENQHRWLHQIGCNLLQCDTPLSPATTTQRFDQLGPMLALPNKGESVASLDQRCLTRPSLTVIVLPAGTSAEEVDEWRRADPTILFAQPFDPSTPAPANLDLQLVPEQLASSQPPANGMPWVVLLDKPFSQPDSDEWGTQWPDRAAAWDEHWLSQPGCSGWIARVASAAAIPELEQE